MLTLCRSGRLPRRPPRFPFRKFRFPTLSFPLSTPRHSRESGNPDGEAVGSARERDMSVNARFLPSKALAGAPCQNQDLLDYRIFRILRARFQAAGAHPYSFCRDFGYGEKGKLGEHRNPENPANPVNPDSDKPDAPLWIPAFAGMTGERRRNPENSNSDKRAQSPRRPPPDSRLSGNDWGENVNHLIKLAKPPRPTPPPTNN